MLRSCGRLPHSRGGRDGQKSRVRCKQGCTLQHGGCAAWTRVLRQVMQGADTRAGVHYACVHVLRVRASGRACMCACSALATDSFIFGSDDSGGEEEPGEDAEKDAAARREKFAQKRKVHPSPPQVWYAAGERMRWILARRSRAKGPGEVAGSRRKSRNHCSIARAPLRTLAAPPSNPLSSPSSPLHNAILYTIRRRASRSFRTWNRKARNRRVY